MKKILAFFFVLFSLFAINYSLLVQEVRAVCPVCTVAVGAGLGVSRALGIDDAVTSVWIGGLILSISFWTVDWIQKRKFKLFKDLKEITLAFISTFLWTLLTILPLYSWKYIGRLNNTLWGIDKIILGTFLGYIVFLFAVYLDRKVRSIRGRQLFNYQKVVFPVVFLLIISAIMYLVTK